MICVLINFVSQVSSLYDEEGFDKDGFERFGEQRLHKATDSSNIKAMKVLLDSGVPADQPKKNEDPNSPLFSASELPAAKLLVERKANIHAKGSIDYRPIHRA